MFLVSSLSFVPLARAGTTRVVFSLSDSSEMMVSSPQIVSDNKSFEAVGMGWVQDWTSRVSRHNRMMWKAPFKVSTISAAMSKISQTYNRLQNCAPCL